LELQQHGVLVSGNQSELADLLPALVVHLGVFIDDDDVGFQKGFRFAFELLGKGQGLWLAPAYVQRLGSLLLVSLGVEQFLGLAFVDFDFFATQ
jgi:hypothetical protein